MPHVMVRMLRTGRLAMAGPVAEQRRRLLDLTQLLDLLPTAAGIDAARNL
ncbi:hypothetical protein AB0P15_28910 [Streptomyces sp. NPDC087917]